MNAWTGAAAWLVPVAFALTGLALGLLLSKLVLARAAAMAAKSSWKYDDILIEAIRGPLALGGALIGLRVAVRFVALPAGTYRGIDVALLILAVLAVTWAIARFVAGLLRAGTAVGALGSVSLLANVARVVIFAIGLLVVLQTLGISITPVLTALGVGGLAVGLALQDTLANFFAGIRILAAGKIRPGDFVLLESGQEGFVEDITWGQTSIRQGTNTVIVPNTKLSQAVTTNFSMPSAPQIVVVNVGVGYGSDLERVEAVALEVARAAQQAVPEGVPEFTPALRFRQFGTSSVDFFVVLQARSYAERWQVVSAFIKLLHARFAQEQIEIPYPVQTVLLKREPPAEARPN